MTLVQDLIRQIKSDPEVADEVRRAILTDDLLAMPKRMDDIDRHLAQIAELTAENSRGIADNSRQIAENSRQIADLKDAVAENGQQIADLKDTVAENGQQIADNSRQIADLKDAVAENGQQIADNSRGIHRLDSLLLGDRAERRAVRWLRVFINGRLPDVGELDLIYDQFDVGARGFYADLTSMSFTEGKIDGDELQRLNDTDIVFEGKVNDESRLFPVEVSITINRRDVRQVRRSAELLARLTGQTTTPVVAGSSIRDAARDFAQREGVEVCLFSI